jgi:arylsulfatase
MTNTHQTRRRFLKSIAISTAALALPSCATARQKGSAEIPPRPNIILIMADDLGYSDIGCFGGEVDTPNLDRLAAGGMRFKQFYNCAKCNPTRASLLTGQYDQAVGLSDMEHGVTFAEVLRPIGYRTIISGKWHQNPLPTTRGFDRYWGLADGACNYWNPGTEARPGEPAPGRKIKGPRRWADEGTAIMGYVPDKKDFYTTDEFASYAIDRLEEYKDEPGPFLLYLPFTAPHYPLHAWPEDIAKYRGKYLIGWDKLRNLRYKRQIEMGLIDPRYKLSPRDPKVAPWDTLTDKQKDDYDLLMSVYAAMVDRLDRAIGRVLDKVGQLGKEDNTLVLFLADNGGCAENVNTTPDTPPGPVQSYRTLGPEWANACNAPYRKYKSTDYHGGNCTPFIAYWPGVIKPDTMTDQPSHIIDILPTFMDITGAPSPIRRDGRKLKPVAGISLLPVFQGRQRQPHDTLFWQFGQAKALRRGNYKLVRYGNDPWELYDLNEDRTELDNLAEKHPDTVHHMSALWQQWFDDCKKPPA